MTLTLALCQINPTVGDFAGNAAKILDAYRKAARAGADAAIFPECAVLGYPPEDLLLRASFLNAAERSLREISSRVGECAMILGFVQTSGKQSFNAAAWIWRKKVRGIYQKRLLPNYGVFDEQRYFSPGRSPGIFRIRGARVGVTICEDLWFDQASHNLAVRGMPNPVMEQARKGAQILINISASPYHSEKLNVRLRLLRQRARQARRPIVYVNLVGGQDELVFDGRSTVVDAAGRPVFIGQAFREEIALCPFEKRGGVWQPVASTPVPEHSEVDAPAEIYEAIVLGLRDYVGKNGFRKVILGLSGGIDSALTAAIAVDALGKDRVVGVTLPTRFSSRGTRTDAQRVAENLGIDFHSIPIEPLYKAFLKTLAPYFKGQPAGLAEENLQPRIRANILLAFSNKFGHLVVTTGNKSEVSSGYCTLYGDTAGGFAVLKDVPKTLVYRLSRWVNEKAGREIIPEATIRRAPTAELRFNQKDQDTLPPYDLLDRMIHDYVEDDLGYAEMIKKGYDPKILADTLRRIDANEYKRRQSPPGVKITPKAFGRDRRMPITNRFKDR